MKDKISQVCDYILDRLESGEYKTGEAIPAARKIAQEVDASFAMIQHAVATLVQAGILRSVSRQGTVSVNFAEIRRKIQISGDAREGGNPPAPAGMDV